MSFYDKLQGATGRFWNEKDTVFFKPYQSIYDGVTRAASIVTAPVIFATNISFNVVGMPGVIITCCCPSIGRRCLWSKWRDNPSWQCCQ